MPTANEFLPLGAGVLGGGVVGAGLVVGENVTPITGDISATFGFESEAIGLVRSIGNISATFGFESNGSGVALPVGSISSTFGFDAALIGSVNVAGTIEATFGFLSAGQSGERPEIFAGVVEILPSRFSVEVKK